MYPYKYQNQDFADSVQLKEVTGSYLRYVVNFPAAHQLPYPEPNAVHGEYYRPVGSSHFPLAILIHGMGDLNVVPCRVMARSLAKKGIASFILYLVYHSIRMPKDMKNRFPALTSEEWFETYRTSVIEIRQIVDWAKDMTEINTDKIAVVGTSVGGILSSIAMGIDKRIKAGVFIITGGNWEVMTWHSKSRTARTNHNCTREECHLIHTEHYPRYMAEIAEKGIENVTPVKSCFLTDPITFAAGLRNRHVFMINARWDQIVPRQCSVDLWQASGNPPILWLPATHLTIYLWYPLILQRVRSYLAGVFNMKNTP